MDEAALVSELETLNGVESVALCEGGRRIHLIVSAQHVENGGPLELEARSIVARQLGTEEAADREVVVSYLDQPEPRRRVRIEGHELRSDVRTVEARVTLEWLDRKVSGSATGMPSEAAAVRLPAQATLRALEAMVDERIRFRLLGVKLVQAFDHSVVVTIIGPQIENGKRLAGVSVVDDGVETLEGAAVRAVLNATNRILGNYLVVD